jgi:hypothetical protein
MMDINNYDAALAAQYLLLSGAGSTAFFITRSVTAVAT